MAVSIFRSRAREDARAKLIDCTHYSDAELDAAAGVLARSNRHEDQSLAAMWRQMRAMETARAKYDAEVLI